MLAAVLLVPIVGLGTARADDQDLNDPAFWPTSGGVNPSVDTTAHSIRYFGDDRYQTNLATGLAGIGDCDYPYDDSGNRNPDFADDLAGTDCWWGADGFPESIIVTAGDKFPDSLTASSMSSPDFWHDGPTAENLSQGGTDSDIATEDAPIVITHSTREGATGLSATAARLARRLVTADDCSGDNDGVCAFNAIIAGGPAAVPTGVESELAAIGYTNVYRIGGVDRYDTAKLISFAMGTGSAGPFNGDNSCGDDDPSDGVDQNFWDNAAPEFWSDSSTCEILPQTVVIADGLTGADALAAGWFTSFYGMPILLTGPNGSITDPTQSALQTLNIQNIVVLGGNQRIPDTTLTQAAGFAGITSDHVFRVSGDDRMATSVALAQAFGGWWPQGDTTANDSFTCIVASGGEGDNAIGWPDDLGAGPVCGMMGGDAVDPHQPDRLLPPVNGTDPIYASSHPNYDWVPILVTQPGVSSLSDSVSTLLSDMFPENPDGSEDWCDSNTTTSCEDPGFAVTFGGPNVISDGAFKEMATIVSGGKYTDFSDMSPSVTDPFFTRLDLGPIFNDTGTGFNVCALPLAMTDVEWMATYNDEALTDFDSSTEETVNTGSSGGYSSDSGNSNANCHNFNEDTDDDMSTFVGVSLSGHFTDTWNIDYTEENSFTMSGDASGGQNPTSFSGVDSGDAPSNGDTFSETYGLDLTGVNIDAAGTTCVGSDTGSAVNLTFTVVDEDIPAALVTGTFTLNTSCGTYTGSILAIGVQAFGFWFVDGTSTITGGTGTNASALTGARGGFVSQIGINGAGNGDDTLDAFQADAIIE